jgi:DNA-directed RNA polymerase subunit omega
LSENKNTKEIFMRLETIIADALETVGHDRYKLSLLVSKRVDQLFKGEEPLVQADTKKMKLADVALMEIAQGKVALDSIA